MTEALHTQNDVTYEQFRNEWLAEFQQEGMAPFEKGLQFAFKLVTQWLDVNEDDEDLIICDGSGDGGIDLAYLRLSSVDSEEDEKGDDQGHVWYLFQSKYGTAFQGRETIFAEGHKVIATLTGENTSLSDVTGNLIERLNIFKQTASEQDRIILVFATDAPLAESDRRALEDLRILGRAPSRKSV